MIARMKAGTTTMMKSGASSAPAVAPAPAPAPAPAAPEAEQATTTRGLNPSLFDHTPELNLEIANFIYFPVMAKGLGPAIILEASGLPWTGPKENGFTMDSWAEMKK